MPTPARETTICGGYCAWTVHNTVPLPDSPSACPSGRTPNASGTMAPPAAENVKVAVRVRPLNSAELEARCQTVSHQVCARRWAFVRADMPSAFDAVLPVIPGQPHLHWQPL